MAKRYKESNGLFTWEVSEMSDKEFSQWFHKHGVRLPNGWWTHRDDEGDRVDEITNALGVVGGISDALPADIAENTVGTGRGRKTLQQIQDRDLAHVRHVLARLDTLEDGRTRELCAMALRAGGLLALCEVRARSGVFSGRRRSTKGLRPREASIHPEAVRDAYERIRSANPHLSKASAVKHVAKRIGCCERSVWDLLPKKKH